MKQKVLFLQKKVLFLYKKVLWYKWKCYDIKQRSLIFSRESNKVLNGVPYTMILKRFVKLSIINYYRIW